MLCPLSVIAPVLEVHFVGVQGVDIDLAGDFPLCSALVVVIQQVLGDRAKVGPGVFDVVAFLARLQEFEAGFLGEVLDVVLAGQAAAEMAVQAVDEESAIRNLSHQTGLQQGT